MSLAPYTHLYLMRPIGFFDMYNITYKKKKKTNLDSRGNKMKSCPTTTPMSNNAYIIEPLMTYKVK